MDNSKDASKSKTINIPVLYCSMLYKNKKIKSWQEGEIIYYPESFTAILFDHHKFKLESVIIPASKGELAESKQYDFQFAGFVYTSEDLQEPVTASASSQAHSGASFRKFKPFDPPRVNFTKATFKPASELEIPEKQSSRDLTELMFSAPRDSEEGSSEVRTQEESKWSIFLDNKNDHSAEEDDFRQISDSKNDKLSSVKRPRAQMEPKTSLLKKSKLRAMQRSPPIPKRSKVSEIDTQEKPLDKAHEDSLISGIFSAVINEGEPKEVENLDKSPQKKLDARQILNILESST